MLSVPQVIENRQEENKNKKIMSKIVKLTEADLTRIVRRVIQENEENSEESFDFSQIHNKLLRDLFTAKHGFKYVDNVNGMEIYSLPRRGFTIMVAIKPANNPSNVGFAVHVKFPMGKSVNYLQEVKGMGSMISVPINDYNQMTRLIQGAIDFGKAQDDYDNLPRLR